MSPTTVATVSVDVPVDPVTAFEIFTSRIDDWWRRGPHSWNNPERAVGMRFEPGAGGRWLEVWDERTGEGFEIGRIRVWEPGVRLVFSHRTMRVPEPQTEVEVHFQAIEGGTRVVLRHFGWEKLPPGPERTQFERMQLGWSAMMGWFNEYVAPAGREGDR